MNPELFKDVSWEEVFPVFKLEAKKQSKFVSPVKPLPWVEAYEANVHRTAEWLLRNGRSLPLQHIEELFITEVGNFWYHMDIEPGRFIHVCFPQDLLQFRHKYGMLYEEYINLPFTKMSIEVIKAKKKLTEILWSQWNCMGGDGVYSFDKQENLVMTYFEPDEDKEQKYANKCSRCQDPLPRGIKIFAQMQYGSFKDV